MPYTKLCKPIRQSQGLRNVIKEYMDIERKSQADMAVALNLKSRQTFGKKLDNPDTFSHGELKTIRRYLRIPIEQMRDVSYI